MLTLVYLVNILFPLWTSHLTQPIPSHVGTASKLTRFLFLSSHQSLVVYYSLCNHTCRRRAFSTCCLGWGTLGGSVVEMATFNYLAGGPGPLQSLRVTLTGTSKPFKHFSWDIRLRYFSRRCCCSCAGEWSRYAVAGIREDVLCSIVNSMEQLTRIGSKITHCSPNTAS